MSSIDWSFLFVCTHIDELSLPQTPVLLPSDHLLPLRGPTAICALCLGIEIGLHVLTGLGVHRTRVGYLNMQHPLTDHVIDIVINNMFCVFNLVSVQTLERFGITLTL